VIQLLQKKLEVGAEGKGVGILPFQGEAAASKKEPGGLRDFRPLGKGGNSLRCEDKEEKQQKNASPQLKVLEMVTRGKEKVSKKKPPHWQASLRGQGKIQLRKKKCQEKHLPAGAG